MSARYRSMEQPLTKSCLFTKPPKKRTTGHYSIPHTPITQQTHVQLSTFDGGELEMMIELGQKWIIDRNSVVTLLPTVALSATELMTFLRRISATPLVVEYSRRNFVTALIEFERMLTTLLARSCFIQFPDNLRAFIQNDRLVFAHYDEQAQYGYLLVSYRDSSTLPSFSRRLYQLRASDVSMRSKIFSFRSHDSTMQGRLT